tara:strand:+ start:1707 stop:1901 length:195 start_codon:yes stop_codon:yes gene_type:complete
MTPKEKATELVDKMYDTQGPEYGITFYEAIDCALIAVDEILSAHLFDLDEREYWIAVKQEIELL